MRLEDGPQIGSIIDVKVIRLEPYGAWVEYQSLPGLIRIPEISWGRVRHPSDVLTVGQTISVKVLGLSDNGYERFAASIRASHPEQNLWHCSSEFAVGRRFLGHVTLVLDYGAFVKIKENVEGLIFDRVNPHRFKVGDLVDVVVKAVDVSGETIELDLVT